VQPEPLNVVDLGDGAVLVFHRYGPYEPWAMDDSIVEVVELRGPDVDTRRPGLLPPVAMQLAALRQRTLELAGVEDDDDEQRQIDLRLLAWFREQRARAASDDAPLQD
jgi:hypothetical protein